MNGRPVRGHEQRAIGSECDDDGLADAGIEQTSGERLGRLAIRTTCGSGELAAIRRQHIHGAEVGRGETARRSRVQDRESAGPPGRVERRGHARRGDLPADEHDIGRQAPEPIQRLGDQVGSEPKVRTGRDADEVLGRGVDEDERDAGRGAGDRQRAREVDSLGLQAGPGVGPERVVADGRDEERGPAETRGRDRLVAAFAALMALERAAGHGLAGRRQPLPADDEVDIDGADDDDPAAHRCARAGSIRLSR